MEAHTRVESQALIADMRGNSVSNGFITCTQSQHYESAQPITHRHKHTSVVRAARGVLELPVHTHATTQLKFGTTFRQSWRQNDVGGELQRWDFMVEQ